MDSYYPTSISRPQWCSLCPLEPIYPHSNLILRKRWTLNEPECTPSSQLEFLKTSYIISLTESLDWSNVLWLVNASKSLNGHWMVFQSLILSPNCTLNTLWCHVFISKIKRLGYGSTPSSLCWSRDGKNVLYLWHRNCIIYCILNIFWCHVFISKVKRIYLL